MQSDSKVEALQELMERFGASIVAESISKGLYMPETGRPLIFLRWMPDMGELDVPF